MTRTSKSPGRHARCPATWALIAGLLVVEPSHAGLAACYDPHAASAWDAACVSTPLASRPERCCRDLPAIHAAIAAANVTNVRLVVAPGAAIDGATAEPSHCREALVPVSLGLTEHWRVEGEGAAPAPLHCRSRRAATAPLFAVRGGALVVANLAISVAEVPAPSAAILQASAGANVSLERVTIQDVGDAAASLLLLDNPSAVSLSSCEFSNVTLRTHTSAVVAVRARAATAGAGPPPPSIDVEVTATLFSNIRVTAGAGFAFCEPGACGGAGLQVSAPPALAELVRIRVDVSDSTFRQFDMHYHALGAVLGAVGIACAHTDSCSAAFERVQFTSILLRCREFYTLACVGGSIGLWPALRRPPTPRGTPEQGALLRISNCRFEESRAEAQEGLQTDVVGGAVGVSSSVPELRGRLADIVVEASSFSRCGIAIASPAGAENPRNQGIGGAIGRALYAPPSVAEEPDLVNSLALHDVNISGCWLRCAAVSCIRAVGGGLGVYMLSNAVLPSEATTPLLDVRMRAVRCVDCEVTAASGAAGCAGMQLPFVERQSTAAASVGRLLWYHPARLEAEGCHFARNSVRSPVQQRPPLGGGALYVLNAEASLTGTRVEANEAAASSGGGMLASGSAVLRIAASSFTDNSAAFDGADITLRGGQGIALLNSSLTVGGALQRTSAVRVFVRDTGSVSLQGNTIECPSHTTPVASRAGDTPSPVAPLVSAGQTNSYFVFQSSATVACQLCPQGQYALACGVHDVESLSEESSRAQCLPCFDGYTCRPDEALGVHLTAPSGRWTALSHASLLAARRRCEHATFPRLQQQAALLPCPLGQCCADAPGCALEQVCVGGRTGLLCGSCPPGFGMSMFASACVPDAACRGLPLTFLASFAACALGVLGAMFAGRSKHKGPRDPAGLLQPKPHRHSAKRRVKAIMRIVHVLQEMAYVMGVHSSSNTRHQLVVLLALTTSSATGMAGTPGGSVWTSAGCLWPGMSALQRLLAGHATWAFVLCSALVWMALLDAAQRAPLLRAHGARLAHARKSVLRFVQAYVPTTALAACARACLYFADCTTTGDGRSVMTHAVDIGCSPIQRPAMLLCAISVGLVFCFVRRRLASGDLTPSAWEAIFRVTLAIVGAPIWAAESRVEFSRQVLLTLIIALRIATLRQRVGERRVVLGCLTVLCTVRGARQLATAPAGPLRFVDAVELVAVAVAVVTTVALIAAEWGLHRALVRLLARLRRRCCAAAAPRHTSECAALEGAERQWQMSSLSLVVVDGPAAQEERAPTAPSGDEEDSGVQR